MKIRFAAAWLLLLAATFAFAQEIPPYLVLGNNVLAPEPAAPSPVSDQAVTGFAFNYQGALAYCTKDALWTITLPNSSGSVPTPPAPSRLLANNSTPAAGYFEGPLQWDFDAAKLAGFRVGLKENKPATRELWIYDTITRQLTVAVPQVWVNLACWSSDGKKLSYSVSKAADLAQVGLWLLDMNTNGKTKLSPKPARSLAFYDNNTILLYQTPEPVTYRYAFATGKAEKLPGFPAGPWQLSPDGRYRAALNGKNLEVVELNSGNKAFSAPAAAMGGWLPYNNDVIAFLAPDKAPKITVLTGGDKGNVLPLAKTADLTPFPPVQWSGQLQPLGGGANIIWVAFEVNHKLSVLRTGLVPLSQAQLPANHQKSEVEVMLSNMKQVTLAALMFAEDNDETLPAADDFLRLLAPYVKNNQVFDRPGQPDKPVVKISYKGAGVPLKDIDDPVNTVIFKIDLGRYVILGFCDGHAKTCTRKEATEAINNPANALGPNGALKEKYAP